MATPIEMMVEAEKRGILPPDKQPLLAEARKRGLLPGGKEEKETQPKLKPRSEGEGIWEKILGTTEAVSGTKVKPGPRETKTSETLERPDIKSIFFDPSEMAIMALTGGLSGPAKMLSKEGIKRMGEWAGMGIPSIVKNIPGAIRAGINAPGKVARGIGAKELEKVIPPSMTTPTHIPTPTLPQPTLTQLARGATTIRPTEQPPTPPSQQLFEAARKTQVVPEPPKAPFLKTAEERLAEKAPKQPIIPTQPKPTPQPKATPQPKPPTPKEVANVEKIVDTSPIKFIPGGGVEDIRAAYSGAKHLQWTKGNFLAEDYMKAVPDPIDRQALTIYRDAGGDMGVMAKWMEDERLAGYHGLIDRAMKLDPKVVKANEKFLTPYYKTTGEFGMKSGFLNNLQDNYINRLFPPPQMSAIPKRHLRDAMAMGSRIEERHPITGLPTSTYHAKPRQFATIMDRVAETGEHPTTLDSADLLRLYNREFGVTSANNKLINTLKETGLSQTLESNAPTPSGWQRLGNSNTIVDDSLYIGLRAITEPNFMNRIDTFRQMGKYQGLVKTVDLSLSFFHHFTMAMQGLYQTKFGTELLIPGVKKFMKGEGFRVMQEDGAKHGLMTSNIDANKDVLSHLAKGNDGLAKVVNAPIIRQGFKLLEKNNRFLFDDMQKWLKVQDYAKQTSSWLAKHQGATEQEIIKAKRSISHEVNAAYGGLNWEALGKTPSFQAVNRLFLLAPDWTYSNYYLAKQAITGGGPGGIKARSHYISALIGGAAITEGLNKMITGHFTDQNQSGHMFDIEIPTSDGSNATHISLFRGAIGDALRMANLTAKLGPVGGPAQFVAGKAAPFTRTLAGIMANHNWDGQLWNAEKDWWTNTARALSFIGTSAGPIPFGAGGMGSAAMKGVTDPLAYLVAGTGLGRVTPMGNKTAIEDFEMK